MMVRAERGRKRRRAANPVSRTADRTRDPQWQSAFGALKKSLRSKRATGYRVGTITEDDFYGDDA
jgi:hypothetical protein